ncbi:MAG: leucyl aminopeptidase [Acidimicrobiales bacterium]
MPVTIDVDHAATSDGGVGALIVGVRAGHLNDAASGIDAEVAALAGFEAEVGQTLACTTEEGPRLLVGLGEQPDPMAYRRIGAAVARAARSQPSVAVDALVDLAGGDRTAAARALAEGLVLGSYHFDAYREPVDDPGLSRVTIVGAGGRRVSEAVERGVAVATAMVLVRDLVNTPGGDLTPGEFATRTTDAASAAGLDVDVLDLAGIRAERLGGLLGVNRGSSQEARFVTVTHRPEGRPRGRIALVGKGVTFDSGGLSIKTAKGMETMKGDMAGAATVLAVMTLVPLVAPRLEVTAYLPLTDNMLGPDATRVGDVLRIRNGKTVEVLNTDAEGRLILADALSLAAESEPDAIIDVATLTGAAVVALGDRTAAVMGNHDALRDRVLDGAEAAGEPMWSLPLPDHLRKGLDSDVADLRNIGSAPNGGALTAGLFLQEFVADRPWVHLDIAGPAHAGTAYDEHPKGGTGFAVRTLVTVLATWTKLPAGPREVRSA